jgi:anti-anti-sigma regulatory factor
VKARKLIEGSSYDRDALRILFQAFDDAWASQVSPTISSRRPEAAIEAARMKLAHIIRGLARRSTRDAKQLTEAAVQLMFSDPTKLRS